MKVTRNQGGSISVRASEYEVRLLKCAVEFQVWAMAQALTGEVRGIRELKLTQLRSIASDLRRVF